MYGSIRQRGKNKNTKVTQNQTRKKGQWQERTIKKQQQQQKTKQKLTELQRSVECKAKVEKFFFEQDTCGVLGKYSSFTVKIKFDKYL